MMPDYSNISCEDCKYYDPDVDLDAWGVPCSLGPKHKTTPEDALCYEDIKERKMPGNQAELDRFSEVEG